MKYKPGQRWIPRGPGWFPFRVTEVFPNGDFRAVFDYPSGQSGVVLPEDYYDTLTGRTDPYKLDEAWVVNQFLELYAI